LGSLLQFVRSRKKRKTAIKLQKEIPVFYESEENRNVYPPEYYSAAQWIRKNGYVNIPCDFIFEYERLSVEVFKCRESGLMYVVHSGRRMYFPKSFNSVRCKSCYRALLAEQDIHSPHRYYYDCFDGTKPCTVFDIGAAEGIFTLSVIDKIEKAYLFECDEQWLEALRMTFLPYGDKVEIINKYVSDTDSDTSITLDSYMKSLPLSNGYLKMDIEGAELKALIGAECLLKESKIQFISVCTYHLEEIGKDINDFLNKNMYNCSYTPGVMAFGKEPPYFRRGVLYAVKYDR
jgi:hypothetical protein